MMATFYEEVELPFLRGTLTSNSNKPVFNERPASYIAMPGQAANQTGLGLRVQIETNLVGVVLLRKLVVATKQVSKLQTV